MRLLISRRSFVLGVCAASATATLPAVAGVRPALHALRDPNCGCCSAWVQILQADGFDVMVEDSAGTAPTRCKLDNGIPQEMASCHPTPGEAYNKHCPG